VNSFERYMATVKGEKTDFLPRVPILMQFAAEYIGSNYGKFASDRRVLVEANKRCVEDFGFEQVRCISDPYRATQGFGAEIEFVPNAVPRCLKPPLQDSRDLGLLKKPDPLTSERMRDRIEAARAFKELFHGRYFILGCIEGPASEAADLRGVTNFLLDTMDDVSYCCELMDICTEVGIAFAEAQIEAGADTVGIGDAIASQVMPDFYEKYIQPREKRMVDAIHRAGGLVKLHICGNITQLLPGIAGLGVDILDVDHMVDLKAVRDTVGEGVVIAGNIDPASIVRSGTPDLIRTKIRECYEMVGNPFMVNAGCEIPSGTPFENLHAFCEPVPYAE